MPGKSDIRELIQRIAGTWGKANIKIFDATVVSVNVDDRTCIVNSLDYSINNLTVRFMPETSDGDMNVPQKESTVCVAMTDFTEPYVVSTSFIDEKLIVVGNQSYDVKKDKQIFNDGKYGGIPIVKDPSDPNAGLLARLNKIEQDNKDLKQILQDIVTACTGMVTSAVGSPDAFSLVFASKFATYPSQLLIKTTEVMISNPNITHGKSF